MQEANNLCCKISADKIYAGGNYFDGQIPKTKIIQLLLIILSISNRIHTPSTNHQPFKHIIVIETLHFIIIIIIIRCVYLIYTLITKTYFYKKQTY